MLKIRTNPPIRLLYDLRWMELGRAGGVEQAAYELTAAISHLDRKNRYRILAPRSACWEWQFPPGFQASRHYCDPGEPLGQRFHAFVSRCREQGAGPLSGFLPASATRGEFDDLEFDLVHSMCSYVHPEMTGFPGVLTIQDLQHLHYPEFFSKADWSDRERLYRESAASAKHIICSSEFTRNDVSERYSIPLGRISTVWNIPSSAVWREIAPDERRALLGAMGVEGPFLFYPAHDWPHKNHARLIEAFRLAAPELPGDLRLVLTGRPFPPDHPAAVLAQGAGPGARVLHLGYRSPLEVRALFQECLALVFPSLFEGFGMPVAEAIIAGKPVACSNVTSLPEIAGDAAVTFDPCDVDDMAARIVEIATQPGLRDSLADAARRRRPAFSSRSSAIKTIAVYERVFADLSGRGP